MDGQNRIICRLCLKIQDNLDNLKPIEEDMKDILNKVLQKTDFAAIQYPVICTNCADTLMKCFDFKTKCINTRDYIATFINKGTVKLDLIDVYKSKNENSTGVIEAQDVCGLCMGALKNDSALSVDIEGDIALKKMIEQCVPEVDLNIIKKPVICVPCHCSLENCFRFLTNCLNVEEKIKKYCEIKNIDSKDGIELNSLLQFENTYVTRKVGTNSANLIKIENQFCEKIENDNETGIGNGGDIFKFEQMSCDDQENTEEKLELKSESFMDTDEMKYNSEEHFTAENMLVCKDVIKIEEPFCEENLDQMENQKFVFNEEVGIKTDESNCSRFEDGNLPQPNINKGDPEIHFLMHKDPLGVTMYKCDSCLYQTKRKDHIKRHLLKHKDPSEVTMYNCEFCVYQTIRKDTFELHLLTHKNPSEVTMYKCELCSFQAKHKSYIKKHFLVHKDSSELTMYKCDSCFFETKHKKNLESHLLKHKDSSEVTMYKCDSCSYQTNRERNIKRHLLKHKDPSEVTMYKCDSCSYQAKSNDNLKRHLLKHKDPSEVTMYKCDSCSYQTKSKENLKRHLLKHKDSSELTMYKCDSCLFESRHKKHLESHLLKHKDPSEVTMYKCDPCSFQTKYKKSLNRHLLNHKNSSDGIVYDCESCSFQTKQKCRLDMHLVAHKDPSKVTMYKCYSCVYQTIRKSHLKRHLMRHKSPAKLTSYKCDSTD